MQDYVKQKESRSGEAGEFAFTGLQPGMYQLQVKQERFSLFQQSVILGSESERVYPVLPLARESEAVRISGRPASGSRKPEKPLSKESRSGGRVEPAKLLQPLRPAYPAGALARGVEGSVGLICHHQYRWGGERFNRARISRSRTGRRSPADGTDSSLPAHETEWPPCPVPADHPS